MSPPDIFNPIQKLSYFLYLITRSIDASAALAMPGVVTFLTAEHVPGQNRRLWFGNVEELFAEEEVICVGQIIGAIVAENRELAKRASRLVTVAYQDLLPVFFTIQDAIEHQSFFEPRRKLQRGNVEEGLEESDHILEGTFRRHTITVMLQASSFLQLTCLTVV
ncbi:hypothetical protein NFI96_006151 [Prochilodus magdalenae]|nr:hypothetical protein NFI96_006151 [Prochilodus magdalenae]